MTGIPPEVFRGQRDDMTNGPGATSTLMSPEPWFTNWASGNPSGEPVSVNEWTALNYTTLYSCVSLIAGTMASLPLITYEQSGRYRNRARDRSEYAILQNEFNPEMSAMIGRETGNAHLLTWGNSYTQIVRNKSGSKLLRLQPLGPDVVDVRRDDSKRLQYDVYQRHTTEKIATIPADEMLHVPGMGFEGICGYSQVRIAKTEVRTGIAMDRAAERFIQRGIRPPGAIKFPAGKKFASPQQAIDYRNRFLQIHSNTESDIQAIVLEDGSEWEQLGVDPVAAQLLESRKFSRGEICGFYRVPPHMVGQVEKQTSWGTGVEEQTNGFVKFCLLNWIKRVEQEYNRKLFGPDSDYYCEHLLEGLLRGDALKRSQSLEIQHRRGIITDNEWREIENFNPVDGGDIRHFPLNEGRVNDQGDDLPPPVGATPEPTSPPKGPLAPKPPVGLAKPLRKAFSSAVGRCLRKESAEVVRFVSKPDQFLTLVEDFYAGHYAMVRDSTEPLLDAWSAAFGFVVEGYAERHIGRSKGELLTVAGSVTAAGLRGEIVSLIARWQTDRLSEVVSEELQTGVPDDV